MVLPGVTVSDPPFYSGVGCQIPGPFVPPQPPLFSVPSLPLRGTLVYKEIESKRGNYNSETSNMLGMGNGPLTPSELEPTTDLHPQIPSLLEV